MTEPKRPRRNGWERLPPIPGIRAEAWRRKGLTVLSELGTMDAPDGSGDALLTWLVSVSRAGESMASDRDLERVRRDFGMRLAEEDNHVDGRVRDLFLVVEARRRVACECKTTERTIVRGDGFRYTVPISPP